MPQEDPYASIATATPDKDDPYAAIATGAQDSIDARMPTTMHAAPPGTPSTANAPGGPKSQPMSEVRTLTGTPYNPGPIQRTVVDQIGGAVQQAANVSAPVIAHRILQRVGVASPESKLYPEEGTLKDTARDATLLIGTGAAEGMEADEAAGAAGRSATKAAPRGRTVTPPPGADLPPEQVAAIEKANRGYKDATAQIARREKLQAASKATVADLHSNLQRTYAAARGSLDQRWGSFRQNMEGAELDPSAAFNSIEDAKAKYLKGSPASLAQFNNLAKEMGIQEFMEGNGGELKAIPGSGSLPFDTARVHYSAIGDKLAQGDLPGNVYQALKSVQEGLDGQLTEAADTRGLGKEYTTLKGDERQFRNDWVDPKSPLAKAHKALDPNFLSPHVMGRGNEYIANQMKRYTEFGAQPHLPLAARRIADEAATITKKLPEVKELPKPKVAAPKTGKLPRTVGRVAGKVVGGAVGSAVGHPFMGYAMGGEAGAELGERFARRRTVEPPPSE